MFINARVNLLINFIKNYTVPGLVIGKIICRVSGQVSPEETIPIANEVVGNGPRGSVHHYFALFQYRIHRRFSSYEVNLSFFYAVQRQFVVVTGDEITRTKFPADTACILKNHYMCYAFADTEAAHNITWSNLIAMYKRNVHEMIAGHSRYDNVPNPDEVGILSPFRLSPYAITDKGYNCNIL
jgi:hypothetical protein